MLAWSLSLSPLVPCLRLKYVGYFGPINHQTFLGLQMHDLEFCIHTHFMLGSYYEVLYIKYCQIGAAMLKSFRLGTYTVHTQTTSSYGMMVMLGVQEIIFI